MTARRVPVPPLSLSFSHPRISRRPLLTADAYAGWHGIHAARAIRATAAGWEEEAIALATRPLSQWPRTIFGLNRNEIVDRSQIRNSGTTVPLSEHAFTEATLELWFDHLKLDWRSFDPTPMVFANATTAAQLARDLSKRLLRADTGRPLVDHQPWSHFPLPGLANLEFVAGDSPDRWRYREPIERCDIAYLVIPNNPDGRLVSEDELRAMLAQCGQQHELVYLRGPDRDYVQDDPSTAASSMHYQLMHNRTDRNYVVERRVHTQPLVVIDLAFWPHLKNPPYDPFVILRDFPHVRSMVISDTGKSALAKLGVASVSESVRREARSIGMQQPEAVGLINTLRVTGSVLHDTGRQLPVTIGGFVNRRAATRRLPLVLEANHKLLRQACTWSGTRGLPIDVESETPVGVAWIHPRPGGSDPHLERRFKEALTREGIHVAPGGDFGPPTVMGGHYPGPWVRYMRVNLNRPTAEIRALFGPDSPFRRAVLSALDMQTGLPRSPSELDEGIGYLRGVSPPDGRVPDLGERTGYTFEL